MAASRPNSPWRILIVEDDPIIGMMLQDMLVELHCLPVGPAGSVAAALALIDETPSLHGAVLDCNLGAEDVWRVADRLLERKVPFVFNTGYGHTGIAARFLGVPVLNKPYSARALERTLIPELKA
jgi:CheY-like chemotaxis protein